MENDLLKRAKKLEKREKKRKLYKVIPAVLILLLISLLYIPMKSDIIYGTVLSAPALPSSNAKFTQFTAELPNKEIVTVKTKELLQLSSGDRIKINRTISILFKIRRYSFYSKLYP